MPSSIRPASVTSRRHAQAPPAPSAHELSAEIYPNSTGAHTSQYQAAPTDKAQKATHELMARAIVKWSWDGTIPGHVARGPIVDGGNFVDICAIVDASWYKVHHEGACKYIPRSYLDVLGVYSREFRSQFRVGENDPQIVDIRNPYAPLDPPKQNLFVALCCGIRPQPSPYNQGARPPIPALPSE